MRLSDFCNRPHLTSTQRTARFPAPCPARLAYAPHPASRIAAACSARRAARRARTCRLALGQRPGGLEVGYLYTAYQTSQPGGASLDGEPPASTSAATRHPVMPSGASGVEAPEAQVHQAQRSPGGAAIDGPSAPNLPIRAFSAADRACDEASDVPFHAPGWIRSRPVARLPARLIQPDPHHPGPLDPPRPSPRQRTTTSSDQDAFHRRDIPPPAPCACAHDARDHEDSFRYRCSRARGFRHCDPVPALLHPRSAPEGAQAS
jgi:hypothetical protein